MLYHPHRVMTFFYKVSANMTFTTFFYALLAGGALLGGADYLAGNRFGLGSRFRDGLYCIAPMAFNMAGLLVLAPALAQLFGPAAAPLCRVVGVDPAMLGSLFAIDMGGYSVAAALADTESLGLFSGLIVSAMLGGVITYIIPIGFGLITEQDREFFIKGVMLGLIPIPVGSLAGGLAMGISPEVLLQNLLPVCLADLALIAGLLLCPQGILRGFYAFNRFLSAVTICGLVLGALEYLTGRTLLPGTEPILDAMIIPARIAVMLMGCLPLMQLLSRLLHGILEPLGRRLGVNAATLEALLLTTATAIPIFPMLREMPPKGKTVSIAWMVGSMGLLTSHIGFAMGVAPAVGQPQMLAKFLTGILALTIALCIPTASRFYHPAAEREGSA